MNNTIKFFVDKNNSDLRVDIYLANKIEKFTRSYIKKIINLIGNKKIIFTVSPIPLNFTFSNRDVVIANKYSKSVLRAAVENFIDDKNCFYFPSFEIVQDCVGWPNSYKEDKRHVKVEIFKDYIAPKFINSFTDFEEFKI